MLKIRIDRVEKFADGAAFGAIGAYERVIGVASGELDPDDSRNAGIAGIAQAPRNAAGRVAYESDIFLLRPVDPARGNRRLLFDVLNRGRKMMLHMLVQVAPGPSGNTNDPKTIEDAGDGLLFRLGYTLAWAGWDADAPRGNNGMTARLPTLKGVTRDVRDEFLSMTRGPALESFRLSHTAAGTQQPAARLTMRRREPDPPQEIQRAHWRFSDARTVELLPPGTKPEPGIIYDFFYRATDPSVAGIGFAIQRDVVSFLRSNTPDANGTPNPAGGMIAHTFGFGISQAGRFLRDFIRGGFNQGLDGKKVFDGVLTHTAGIGTVFVNEIFSQSDRTRTQFQDHTMPENSFPFSPARTRDPVTGQEAATLPGDKFDPLLIEANTSTEYWQKGASLLATDPEGKHDLALPPTARIFLISGTQHAGRAGATSEREKCVNPRNPHSAAPALRALLVALEKWVGDGTPPPQNRIPRIADGTLVATESLQFPAIPGFVIARTANSIDVPGDWVNPTRTATPYRPLVPAVDADGNERAGLRLPDIAVPAATYTGWNLYAPPFPTDALCDRDGSFLPIATTDAERMPGDPRPSLQARYSTKQKFIALTEAAARQLAAERLLLEEDISAYLAAARAVPEF